MIDSGIDTRHRDGLLKLILGDTIAYTLVENVMNCESDASFLTNLLRSYLKLIVMRRREQLRFLYIYVSTLFIKQL